MIKRTIHLAYVLALFLLSYSLFANTKSAPIILDAFANCTDHINLHTGEKLQIHISVASSRSKDSSISGFINFMGSDEHYPLKDYRFGFPKKDTFSILFQGPAAYAQFFCQDNPKTRELIVHTQNRGNVRLALSKNGSFVDSSISKNGADLQVRASGTYANIFQVGADTLNPYWLQFLLSTHKDNNAELEVQYEFH